MKDVRENHQNKDYHYRKKKKDEFDITCYLGNVSISNENTLLTTDAADIDETDNSIIRKT